MENKQPTMPKQEPEDIALNEVGQSSDDPEAAGPKVKTAGWTGYLVFSILSSVLGASFMYGYNVAVVNAPYDHITGFLNESFIDTQGYPLNQSDMDTQWSLVVSLFLIGGTIGCVWFPKAMSDKFGRKKSLLLISPIGAVGGVLCFISPYPTSFIPLYIGRAVIGFHSGIAMVILPGLLSELAPEHLRGACGASVALGLVIGVSVSNLLGLPWLLGSGDLWNVLFIVATACYVVQAVMLIFSAESPPWLIGNDKDDDAKRTLSKLRKGANEQSINLEFEQTKEMVEAEAQSETIGITDFFKSRQLWWPLILSINTAMCVPLTGIGIVLVFATDVMARAGLDSDVSKLANFGLSIVNILSTIFSMFVVDRLGRRPLMLVSLIGTCLALVFLTIVIHFGEYYASIAGLALFLIPYAIGSGSIPWFLTVEFFVPAARPVAISIALFVIWVFYLAVTFIFPPLLTNLEEYAFLPFAAFSFFEFVFLFCFQPETKGVTPEEIANKYAPGKSLFQFGKASRKDRRN